MKSNILFLDFDGPLIPNKYSEIFKNEPLPEKLKAINKDRGTVLLTYWKMDPLIVKFLNDRAWNNDFQVVISSSWRIHFSREEIVTIFNCNGLALGGRLHTDWRTPLVNTNRASQISGWLEEHEGEIEDYIILDDDQSFTLIKSYVHHGHLWLVSEDEGISFSQLKTLQARIESWRHE